MSSHIPKNKVNAISLISLISLTSLILTLPSLSYSASTSEQAGYFLSKSIWETSKFPGNWRTLNASTAATIKELNRPNKPLFGAIPQSVKIYYAGSEIHEIVITYLEAGNYYGDRKASFDQKKQFNTSFQKLLGNIKSQVYRWSRSPGFPKTIGKGKMQIKVTDYSYKDFLIRLHADPKQLLSLTILKKNTSGNRSRTIASNKASNILTRRSAIASNVKQTSNGDTIIENLPIFNQGDRGYCMMGVLAMLVRYYGLNTNIDTLAARAGYTHGATPSSSQALTLYRSAASEANLKLNQSHQFNPERVQAALKRGEPIIIFRDFSRRRDHIHTAYSHVYAKTNGNVPKDLEQQYQDKSTWPVNPPSGHASVINGYNPKRAEFILTESWGEKTRNRRIPADELKATCKRLIFLSP